MKRQLGLTQDTFLLRVTLEHKALNAMRKCALQWFCQGANAVNCAFFSAGLWATHRVPACYLLEPLGTTLVTPTLDSVKREPTETRGKHANLTWRPRGCSVLHAWQYYYFLLLSHHVAWNWLHRRNLLLLVLKLFKPFKLGQPVVKTSQFQLVYLDVSLLIADKFLLINSNYVCTVFL